jgi:trimethylamine corrinoid protein
MEKEEIIKRARAAILAGDEDEAAAVASDALAAGLSPLEVVSEGFSPAMTRVGELFAEEEYGLPEVVIAADAMKAAMAILEPAMRSSQAEVPRLGIVVLGTAPGDIHDIGKHIVGTMLSVNGFEVHDLGKDVPIEEFMRKAGELKADILGCSAMMTTTMISQEALVKAVEEAGLQDQIKVIVGGATTSQQWADRIRADGWAENANDAVGLAKRLMG